MAKSLGLVILVISIFISCSNFGVKNYIGSIDTSNLQSSLRDINLHYKLFDEQKREIFDNKVNVSFFDRYKIPYQKEAKYLLIYIHSAYYDTTEVSAFIEDDNLFVDLEKNGNVLPKFLVSTQLQIKDTHKDGMLIQWEPLKKKDYVRIDFYRDLSEYPSYLLFIPERYNYVSKQMIDNAVSIDYKENSNILKNDVFIVKSTMEKGTSVFEMDFYSATAFMINNKGGDDIQLTLPTRKYPFRM